MMERRKKHKGNNTTETMREVSAKKKIHTFYIVHYCRPIIIRKKKTYVYVDPI